MSLKYSSLDPRPLDNGKVLSLGEGGANGTQARKGAAIMFWRFALPAGRSGQDGTARCPIKGQRLIRSFLAAGIIESLEQYGKYLCFFLMVHALFGEVLTPELVMKRASGYPDAAQASLSSRVRRHSSEKVFLTRAIFEDYLVSVPLLFIQTK
jgi:hypothetical protein